MVYKKTDLDSLYVLQNPSNVSEDCKDKDNRCNPAPNVMGYLSMMCDKGYVPGALSQDV